MKALQTVLAKRVHRDCVAESVQNMYTTYHRRVAVCQLNTPSVLYFNKKYVLWNVYLPNVVRCIPYTVIEMFDYNCNDLELGETDGRTDAHRKDRVAYNAVR